MIRIDTLNLTLPPELQNRHGAILQHAGDALAASTARTNISIPDLGGLNLRIRPGQSDRSIGRSLAATISTALSRTGG